MILGSASGANEPRARARSVRRRTRNTLRSREGLVIGLGVRSIAGAMRWWEPLSNLHNEPRPAGSGSHSSPNEARPGGSAPGRNHRDTDRRTTAPNPNEPRPAGSGQSEPISPEPLLPGRGSCVRLRNEHLYGARIRLPSGTAMVDDVGKIVKSLVLPGIFL